MSDRSERLNSVDPGLRQFARGQRRDMPTAEALFRGQVRPGRFRGLKFRRQAPIAPYIADFLCVSARVAVELDGPVHEDDTQRRRDAERDARLTKQGFQVLRFPNDLVLGNLDAVLETVSAAIDARIDPPLSAGEGARGAGGRGAGTALCEKGGAPLSRPLLTQEPPSPAEGGGR